jgi:hypothetical protein
MGAAPASSTTETWKTPTRVFITTRAKAATPQNRADAPGLEEGAARSRRDELVNQRSRHKADPHTRRREGPRAIPCPKGRSLMGAALTEQQHRNLIQPRRSSP